MANRAHPWRRIDDRRASYRRRHREPNATLNPDRALPMPENAAKESQKRDAERRRMLADVTTHLCGIHSNRVDLILKHMVELRQAVKSSIPLPRHLDPVRRLVELTNLTGHHRVQLEAARLLALIAVHCEDRTDSLLEAGVCRIFNKLLLEACSQSQWDAASAIEKLSEGGIPCRDQLIEQGVVLFLWRTVSCKDFSRNLRAASRCLKNLFRHPELPSAKVTKSCIPITRTLLMNPDERIKADACQTFLSIVKIEDDPFLDDMVELGCVNELARIVNTALCDSVLNPALDILGVLASCNGWPELVTRYGILKGFRRVLSFPDIPLAKVRAIATTLAAVTNRAELCMEVVNAGFFPLLARLLRYRQGQIQTRAFHSLYNIAAKGNRRSTRMFLEKEMIDLLVDLLVYSYSEDLKEYAMLTLERVVDACRRLNVRANTLWDLFNNIDVIDCVEQMQWTGPDIISSAAKRLMDASSNME